MQRGKKIRMAALALGLAFGISACSSFENFTRVGTYEYEGEKFDVYAADDVEHSDGEVNSGYYVLVPKGERAHHLSVVAACPRGLGAITAASIKGCEQKFGEKLRESREPAAPRPEGGMY